MNHIAYHPNVERDEDYESIEPSTKEEIVNLKLAIQFEQTEAFISSDEENLVESTAFRGPTARVGSNEAEALSQFRNFVGTEPDDETLLERLREADFDLNRAINFYFGVQ